MPQSVRKYLPFAIALFCLVPLIPGFFLSFEDSEIWGITSSRRLIDHPFISTSAHSKPLFSLLFGAIAATADSDWSALIGARSLAILFSAGGLFSFLLLGLVLLSRERRVSATLFFYAILCTMPLLLIHFAKARSDTISASMVLMGAYLLLRLEAKSLNVKGLVFLACGVGALLVTPKSIDLLLVLSLVFWQTSEGSKRSHRFLWVMGPVTVLLFGGLMFSRELIGRSVIYWFDSYEGVQYFSRLHWVSFNRAFETAPVVSLMLAAGMITGAVRFRWFGQRERLAILAGVIVSLFILMHSQKFFFFLASRIPFIALGALPGFHLLVESANRRFESRTVIRLFVAILSISTLLATERLLRYPGFQQREQRAVYESLGGYLKRAGAHWYWDGIGLFPTQNRIFHFPSPRDRANEDMLEYVDISRPTLILRTSKMELLEPQFMIWLRSRYINVTSQIYARFRTLAPTKSCQLDPGEIGKIMETEQFKFPIAIFVKTKSINQFLRTSFKIIGGGEFLSLDSQTLNENKFEVRDCDQIGVFYAIAEAGPFDALPAPDFTLFFGYDGRL